MDINGKKLDPLTLLQNFLFPKWEMKDGDKDFTVMRIIIKGVEKGKMLSINIIF